MALPAPLAVLRAALAALRFPSTASTRDGLVSLTNMLPDDASAENKMVSVKQLSQGGLPGNVTLATAVLPVFGLDPADRPAFYAELDTWVGTNPASLTIDIQRVVGTSTPAPTSGLTTFDFTTAGTFGQTVYEVPRPGYMQRTSTAVSPLITTSANAASLSVVLKSDILATVSSGSDTTVSVLIDGVATTPLVATVVGPATFTVALPADGATHTVQLINGLAEKAGETDFYGTYVVSVSVPTGSTLSVGPVPRKTRRLALLTDSVVVGKTATQPALYGVTALLRAQDTTWDVANTGRGGMSATNGLGLSGVQDTVVSQLVGWFAASSPAATERVLGVQLGANDANQGLPVGPYATAISGFIDKLHAADATIKVALMEPYYSSTLALQPFRDAMSGLISGRAHFVTYVPTLNVFNAGNSAGKLADGTHLNNTGAAFVAPALGAALRLLPANRGSVNSPPVASNVALTFSGAPAVGSIAALSHSYYDAEGDLENGTTQQVIRYDNTSGLNPVVAANPTTNNYTVVAADQGKYLLLAVTPRAANGGVGAVVYSAYTPAIASGAAAPISAYMTTAFTKDFTTLGTGTLAALVPEMSVDTGSYTLSANGLAIDASWSANYRGAVINNLSVENCRIVLLISKDAYKLMLWARMKPPGAAPATAAKIGYWLANNLPNPFDAGRVIGGNINQYAGITPAMSYDASTDGYMEIELTGDQARFRTWLVGASRPANPDFTYTLSSGDNLGAGEIALVSIQPCVVKSMTVFVA